MFGAAVTVTPPAGELIDLEQAKSFLRVDGNALDGEIELTTAAAIGDLEDMTGLRLLSQVVSVTADSFADLQLFRVGPIKAVSSIAYRDAAGAEQLLDPDSYELHGAPFEQGVRLKPGHSWPAGAAGSIMVTLQVGYGADAAHVPPNLRFAAFAILRGKYEQTPVDVESLIINHRFWL